VQALHGAGARGGVRAVGDRAVDGHRPHPLHRLGAQLPRARRPPQLPGRAAPARPLQVLPPAPQHQRRVPPAPQAPRRHPHRERYVKSNINSKISIPKIMNNFFNIIVYVPLNLGI